MYAGRRARHRHKKKGESESWSAVCQWADGSDDETFGQQNELEVRAQPLSLRPPRLTCRD